MIKKNANEMLTFKMFFFSLNRKKKKKMQREREKEREDLVSRRELKERHRLD